MNILDYYRGESFPFAYFLTLNTFENNGYLTGIVGLHLGLS